MANDHLFQPGKSGNPNGRPKGSTNKIPSNKEIIDGFKKQNKRALEKLVSLMSKGKEDTQFKAAVKILDINYQITLAEEKNKVKAKDKPTKPSTIGHDGVTDDSAEKVIEESPKAPVRKLTIAK